MSTKEFESGIPFKVKPNLESSISETEEDRIIDEIELLERVGNFRGKLRIIGDKEIIHAAYNGDYNIGIRTPAGPIEVRQLLTNGEVVPSAFPVTFVLEVANLTPEQALETSLAFIYQGQRYSGEPHHNFLPEKTPQQGTLYAYSWIDPNTKEEAMEYFPNQDQTFDNLDFVITLPPSN